MALISAGSSPYLNPGILPLEPFPIKSRIVSSLPSTNSLYNTGPYLFAPGVDSVWQTAQRCWNMRRPSICVSFNGTGVLDLACWAGTASGNATTKKRKTSGLLLIRAPQAAGSTRRRHSAGFPLAALLWRASGASSTWSPLELRYGRHINANSTRPCKGPQYTNCQESSHTPGAISISMFYVNPTGTSVEGRSKRPSKVRRGDASYNIEGFLIPPPGGAGKYNMCTRPVRPWHASLLGMPCLPA